VTLIPIVTLIAAVVAAGTAAYAARLQRRSGMEAARAAEKSAEAAHRSAEAAEQAVSASRSNAEQLEARSRREEVMRSLRWAAEMAVSSDAREAVMGVRQLGALGRSPLLDSFGQLLVDEALATVIKASADSVQAAGESAQVVEHVVEASHGDVALTDPEWGGG
jgi:hypothetical protein